MAADHSSLPEKIGNMLSNGVSCANDSACTKNITDMRMLIFFILHQNQRQLFPFLDVIDKSE